MDCPPRLQADPRAKQACRDQREKSVEGNGAQSEPHRSIRREERQHSVLVADGREVIDHCRDRVDDDEREPEQGDVSMEAKDEEPRRPRRAPAHRAHHTEKNTGAQKHERHDTCPACEVPQHLSIAARCCERQQGRGHEPPDTATGGAGVGVGAGACAGPGFAGVDPESVDASAGGGGIAGCDRWCAAVTVSRRGRIRTSFRPDAVAAASAATAPARTTIATPRSAVIAFSRRRP